MSEKGINIFSSHGGHALETVAGAIHRVLQEWEAEGGGFRSYSQFISLVEAELESPTEFSEAKEEPVARLNAPKGKKLFRVRVNLVQEGFITVEAENARDACHVAEAVELHVDVDNGIFEHSEAPLVIRSFAADPVAEAVPVPA